MSETNRGRPAHYKSPEEMQAAIEAFFENPPTVKVYDKDGTCTEVPKITITGLALALGFESRQSFYDYEKRADYSYFLKRARLMVEQQYETMLTSGGQAAGPIFALKQFGWRDNLDTKHSGSIDVSSMTPEQLANRAQQLLAKMNGESTDATEEGQQPENDQQ